MARAKKEAPQKTAEELLLEQGKERFKLCQEAWGENHKRALEDIKFRNLEQWPEKVKQAREKKGRPTLVVDKCNQYIRQVVNDGRQNRPSVKVRPVDDKADIKVAEGFQGLIRGICANSNADEAFDTALDHAAGNGFGFFRVLTEYADDAGFEQNIVVRRIRNPLAVMIDPTAQMADGSDAEYGFVVDDMPKDEFKRRFPKAEHVDWKDEAKSYGEGWLTELTVRVCEYWYKEDTESEALLLADGTSTTKEDYDAAVNAGVEVQPVVNRRTVRSVKVKFCRMSGAEILEQGDWLGKYIPIIPVYGSELDIEGKVIYSGLVRPARDPQMLYNYARSAFAERVALAPKSPWVAANGQIENNPEWDTANTENHSVLGYDPIDVAGRPVPPPQRVSATDIPAGFAQDMQISEHDIQAAIGMYAASVGEASNEKSGRAIMARQREGDTATFHYQDNLNRAVRYLGRILVDLIPKIYDTRRVVRVLGEDDESSDAQINPALDVPYAKVPGRDGKPMPVFNLNVGRYDVDVSAGPSYTTKRQEAADAMIEMTRANPAAWATHGDLIVKSQDWPGAEEFAKRSKAVMPPELKAAIAEEENDEEGPSPEVRGVMEQADRMIQEREAQIEQLMQALQQATQEAEFAKKQAADKEAEVARKTEADVLKAEADKRAHKLKEEEVRIKAYEARTRRLQVKMGETPAGGVQEPPVGDGELSGWVEAPLPDEVMLDPPHPDVVTLVEAMQAQTAGLAEALVGAITAPRINVPERGPDGRIERSISIPAPEQIQ